MLSKPVQFYYVTTETKTFLVNTCSEEKAKQLVKRDYKLTPIDCGLVYLMPNLCCDIENIFM